MFQCLLLLSLLHLCGSHPVVRENIIDNILMNLLISELDLDSADRQVPQGQESPHLPQLHEKEDKLHLRKENKTTDITANSGNSTKDHQNASLIESKTVANASTLLEFVPSSSHKDIYVYPSQTAHNPVLKKKPLYPIQVFSKQAHGDPSGAFDKAASKKKPLYPSQVTSSSGSKDAHVFPSQLSPIPTKESNSHPDHAFPNPVSTKSFLYASQLPSPVLKKIHKQQNQIINAPKKSLLKKPSSKIVKVVQKNADTPDARPKESATVLDILQVPKPTKLTNKTKVLLSQPVTTESTTTAKFSEAESSYQATTSSPEEMTTYSLKDIKNLWDKALGIVGDVTTDISVIGLKGMALDNYQNEDYEEISEYDYMDEVVEPEGIFDNALAAVDISSLLTEVLSFDWFF